MTSTILLWFLKGMLKRLIRKAQNMFHPIIIHTLGCPLIIVFNAVRLLSWFAIVGAMCPPSWQGGVILILICIKYHLLKNNTKDCGQLELIVTNTAVAGTACRHIGKTTNTLVRSSDVSNIVDGGFKVEGKHQMMIWLISAEHQP
jgi:hypothetical protein